MGDGFLHKYYMNNASKPLHKWLHYFDIYERHLERFRNKRAVMIEIGVFKGGSLAMWKEYLGEGCQIVGIDIDPACKAHEGDGIEVFIGSQSDPDIIDSVFKKYPNVDIILDDGSHINEHMIGTFEMAYSRVGSRGVYIVEDTHTSYWQEHRGGLGLPTTFIEFVKKKLDDLNAAHTRDALPISDFTRTTDSITTYDSVVVFEKRPQGARQAPTTEPMA